MFKKILFFSTILFLGVNALFAQSQPSMGLTLPADAPGWMQKMHEPNPNVFDIQREYQAYYADHAFEKNTYTQFYKRWMRWAKPFTTAAGTIQIPSVAEQEQLEKTRLQARFGVGTESQNRSAAGNWTFAGPKIHLHDDGNQTPISRHTNIYAFDVAPSNANILYAGGETGGIWRTNDKGLNWVPLGYSVIHGSFGAIKIHPTNPDIVWAATGGKIIKTTNGGTTWTTVYTQSNLWVDDIAVSQTNPDVVLAASEQGLLRSTNGGTTWTTKFTNRTWTCKQKVGDGNTFFAVRENGISSEFVSSSDMGNTWTVQPTGWYVATAGQDISGALIATCASNPSKLYVYLMGDGGILGGYVGVYVSNNSGTSWANTHPSNTIGQPYSIPNHVNLMDADGIDWFYQGFYDAGIAVNPNNENELIAGGCSWWKSTNGGQTWSPFGGYVGNMPGYRHPDVQKMAWVGNDLWISSDGGIDYSANGGATIESRNRGISGVNLWGFDSGWNEDILVGGRYHNGNMARYQDYPAGTFLGLGGAEAATGYVNPGPGRKTYHSDIGGYAIPTAVTGIPQYFGVSTWPNESYAYYANSEMVWHPDCWGIVFLGKDNKLWKSTDGGSTFAAVYTFPGNASRTVYDIEISRSQPKVMYVSQWNGTDDAIYKSTDGGQTFSLCTALPLPNNNDRVKMAVSGENPDVLWVAVTYGSNGKKIYKTTDGGLTWNNLTTAALNGLTIENIMAQYGTDGGIYLGTTGGVFYRNNTHADWQAFSTGLPATIDCNRLKPFYKTGKIRNGTWSVGVWESNFFETSVPQAKAMSNKLYSGCARDTFFFDDYSNVKHTGATWAWQFPGAAYFSNPNRRNPKAVYAAPGTYQAIMALTYAGVTTFDTLSLTVGSECSADVVPGKALRLGGNTPKDYVILAPFNITSNTISFSAWIKPDGIQPDYASVFMHDGESAGLHFQPGNNRLGYHWPNGAWWWDSGLTVPSGVWSHVALVVSPTQVTIYLNGVPSSHNNLNLPPVAFTSSSRLGNYKGWGSRHFKGDIDEACFYKKSLTMKEVREKMNLVKIPTSDPHLLGYYQFNEASGTVVYDRAKTYHGGLAGNSIQRIDSKVAVGPGGAYTRVVSAGGTQSFSTRTNVNARFPATGPYPNNEVVVTRINLAPDQNPNTDPISSAYWVIRNYNPTTQNFNTLTQIFFDSIGNVPSTTTANQYKLFRRPANAEGNTWTLQDEGDVRRAGTNGRITFSTNNNISSFGAQFVITKPVSGPNDLTDAGAIPTDEREAPEVLGFDAQLSPNPVATNGTLMVRTTLDTPATFKLLNSKGQAVRLVHFTTATDISLEKLPAGVYFYSLENEAFMKRGQVVIQ